MDLGNIRISKEGGQEEAPRPGDMAHGVAHIWPCQGAHIDPRAPFCIDFDAI
jgi:hypothetical protein